MEEKGTETNKNECNRKQNLNLMAIDELYYKLRTHQKNIRCKSANIHNSKRKINANGSIFHNEFLSKEKNNSIELPQFSPPNSAIINRKNKTIDLTYLLKTNDSKGIDSTKQSTRRLFFSGRTNSSIINRTKILDNKKKNLKKKSLSVININADIEKYFDVNSKMYNKTTKDFNLRKLMNKLKIIDFKKFIDKNKDNKKNIEKAKVYDLMPGILLYIKQKEYNTQKKFVENKNNIKLNQNKNNELLINNSNYKVKYKFLDNIINNIHHIVNFVDVEKREEIKQNVIKDYHNHLKKLITEDFKTYGYELDPEIIKKQYQDEKQSLIRKKYKELKKEILNENLKNVAFQKMIRSKMKNNYIPEYLRIQNELWNKKRRKFRNMKNMVDKSTSVKGLIDNQNKEENENHKIINEYSSNYSKKKLNNHLETIKKAKKGNIKKKTLFNFNHFKQDFKNNEPIDTAHSGPKKKEKTLLRDYNKIVSIFKADNFCLKGNNDNIQNFNKEDIIENNKNDGSFVKTKVVKKPTKNIARKLSKKNIINFQKKKSINLENRHNKIYHKKQIILNNLKKEDLNRDFNFNIIKQNIINEENQQIKKRNKKRKKSRKNTIIKNKNKRRKDNKTKSSYNETKKSDISFEEIERRLIQRNTKIEISIINTPKNDKQIQPNEEKDKKQEKKNNKKKIDKKISIKENRNQKNEKVDRIEITEEKSHNISIKDEFEDMEEEEINVSQKVINDKRVILLKNKLSKQSMDYFIQEHKYNSLSYLINQKYEEIEKKNNDIGIINIDDEISENQRRFSSFSGLNITSVEDIEYKKNILLYKLKENIRNKIKEGKYDINELDNFKKFENKINEYQINYNIKDVNKIKEYFLLLSRKFYEFQEEMNSRETQKFEEMRINKFIKNLNYEFDFNIPRSILEKGKRCRSCDLYRKLISLSEIKNKKE